MRRTGDFSRLKQDEDAYTQRLPARIRQFVGPRGDDNRQLGRILFLQRAQKVLRALVAGDKAGEDFRKELTMDLLALVRVNASGHLETTLGPLARLFEGQSTERIRLCPICNRIFWAKRVDQPCCSKQHARMQRSRRWSKKYPDTYKLNRILGKDSAAAASPLAGDPEES